MSNTLENMPFVKDSSRRSFIKMAGAMGAAAAFTASLAACSGPASTTSQKTGSANGGKIDKNATIQAGTAFVLSGGFDPMNASSAVATAANYHIFEGLVELDPVDRTPYPALASEAPKQVDDLTWRATLRKGATFHNGSKVTTDDVVYSFTRVLDPANTALLAQFIPFIASVKAVDASTVEFKLNKPFPLFGTRISVVKVVPKAIASADQKGFDAKPVGTGPYAFVSVTPNDNVAFKRFDAYNGPRPALAAAMTWYMLADNSARTTAIQSGRVQAVEAVPYLDIDAVKAKAEVKSVPSFNSMFLMFNCAKAPFNDVRVRQALFYALDVEKIVKTALLGNGTPATNYVQDTHPDYKRAGTVYTYNPDKAKALLKEAGQSNLSVELLTTTTAFITDSVPLVKQFWDAIGVKTTLNSQASANVYGNNFVGTGNFQVLAASGDPSIYGNDMDLLLSWFYAGTTWPKNRYHWDNTPEFAQVTKLLAQAAAEKDATKQKAAWNQVVDIVAENVPLYPLYHVSLPTAWNSSQLSGFRALPTTGLSFENVGRV
ncbi:MULTISPECIES: ABC transporter substrate-binding protein [unclassified Arthrobacter]|uniref:ABC transporter substrate-binding protein n=1 Tax=unclassified Arthrobacter TaxID=235627 RepID=UPI00159D5F0D|nr:MULTISPECIES: ABC transporter substrate-binding protein [unclassified Arthrobacter]MCQ9165009.1 ABC transporter substrate-binding protein [Arthrobacter sp. STN4]NVM98927.1 ABC transporter substrate-binding protein [Arthrobacter sp. SDTb3-6]